MLEHRSSGKSRAYLPVCNDSFITADAAPNSNFTVAVQCFLPEHHDLTLAVCLSVRRCSHFFFKLASHWKFVQIIQTHTLRHASILYYVLAYTCCCLFAMCPRVFRLVLINKMYYHYYWQGAAETNQGGATNQWGEDRKTTAGRVRQDKVRQTFKITLKTFCSNGTGLCKCTYIRVTQDIWSLTSCNSQQLQRQN